MKILALELSSRRGSIARLDDGNERFACEFANDRQHSGAFFENLATVTREFDRPDLIAVGIGPGSYAGVRIAISAAIGLRAATEARLIGLPSICAIPARTDAYTVIGDARRHTFYYASVAGGACAEGPLLLSESELRARLENANPSVYSTERLSAFPAAEVVAPSAILLARLAERVPVEPTNIPLEPMYLRAPHITQPKKRSAAFDLRRS